MELVPVKYERHIFVCVNQRDEGDCCAGRGEEIVKRLRDHINSKGLFHRFNVSKSRCLGHCENGPTIAVYPDGFIFRKVTKDDTAKIIERFL